MKSPTRNIRLLLAALVVGVVLLNVGTALMVRSVSLESQPETMEQLTAHIEADSREWTKEKAISRLSLFKQFVESSDRLLVTLQLTCGGLAIANILIVLALAVGIWRATVKSMSA